MEINISKHPFCELLNHKNLLAFSGGTDSCALFFVLIEMGIDFDLAIVDYSIRIQSKEEVSYAKELGEKYGKKVFMSMANLPKSNFESEARSFRYSFFEKIIKEESYDNLITAHHLNDRLEWFLMQFLKGAGAVELLGFNGVENRGFYKIIRPFIEISRDSIEIYLREKNIFFFTDETNADESYYRNFIRKNFASELAKINPKGIAKSFSYLEDDSTLLFNPNILFQKQNLYILADENNDIKNIRHIDKIVKKLGFILSSAQKNEILKTKNCVVFSKIAISFSNNKIYISPFIKTVMDKKFKEKMRISKIPEKIRGYCYLKNIDTSLNSLDI